MNLQTTLYVLVVESKAFVSVLGLVSFFRIASSDARGLCDSADTVAYLTKASSARRIASYIVECAAGASAKDQSEDWNYCTLSSCLPYWAQG